MRRQRRDVYPHASLLIPAGRRWQAQELQTGLTIYSHPAEARAFAVNGNHVAVLRLRDDLIDVVEGDTFAEAGTVGPHKGARFVAMSASVIVSCSQSNVRLWSRAKAKAELLGGGSADDGRDDNDGDQGGDRTVASGSEAGRSTDNPTARGAGGAHLNANGDNDGDDGDGDDDDEAAAVARVRASFPHMIASFNVRGQVCAVDVDEAGAAVAYGRVVRWSKITSGRVLAMLVEDADIVDLAVCGALGATLTYKSVSIWLMPFGLRLQRIEVKPLARRIYFAGMRTLVVEYPTTLKRWCPVADTDEY